MKTFNRGLFTRRPSESGFTLIELIIAVVVVGILSSIGFVIFAEQQKAALIATVKSDVGTNRTMIVDEKLSSGYFIPADSFATRAVKSSENGVGYVVNETLTEACTWGSIAFSEDDLYYYHYKGNTVTSESGFGIGPCSEFEVEKFANT